MEKEDEATLSVERGVADRFSRWNEENKDKDAFTIIFSAYWKAVSDLAKDVPTGPGIPAWSKLFVDDQRQKLKERKAKNLGAFQHLPFKPEGARSIRLLKVDSWGPHDLIQCSLQEFRADKAPPYVALSYVWADQGPWMASMFKLGCPLDPDAKRAIVCNGKYLEVSANLHAALLGLGEALHGRYMWTDAICINQTDATEKTEQVRRMDEIYSRAETVFIWLGRRHPVRDAQIAWTASWPKFPNSAADYPIEYMGKKYNTIPDFLVDSLCKLHMWRKFGSSVDLLLHGWFERAWTVQEFVLAKKFAFYYDGKEISASDMENATAWLQSLIEQTQMYRMDFVPPWFLTTGSIFQVRRKVQDGHLLDLSESVLVGALRQAGDPKDNVFALLSLTDPSSLTIPSPSAPRRTLTANYDKRVTAQEVYIDLARHLLYGKMGLSVLSLVRQTDEALVQDQLDGDKDEDTKYDPAQPSMFEKMIRTKQAEKRYTKEQKVWRTQVKPDLEGFKLNAFPSWVPKLLLVRGTQPYYLRGSNNFSAATSMPESFSLSDDGRTLKTSAAVVDAVRFRLPVDGNSSASGGFCFWPVIRPYFIDKLGPESIYKHTGERISTAFWRTLVDDMWNKKHPAPDGVEQYFAQWLAKLEGPAKAREMLDLSYEPKASSFDFGGALLCTATARAFYVTEGGYYGLGPVTVRREDKVLLLPGTQVPYLFREHMVKENSWMLIGETYVHGIMHGEALQKGLAFDPIDIV